ncbi:hypothetical protein [Peribacillus glennii]|uniref:Appr-1-p processing protein n=1 Tax=Peribacillus glennii TaxID=2303991 RepID=A0A372L984_9BACI|nr:hypothetical protein [Peribacillus glennii]RFU61776.1 hypothetical protein D0466_16685 [Peribacillus glennii]
MLDNRILIQMKEYVESHLIIVTEDILDIYLESNDVKHSILEEIDEDEIENFINTKRKPTLSQVLFSFLDKKDASDSKIYKKAGMDRRHFSKIRTVPNYRPGKNTTIALALALELDQTETEELLGAAGYTLSNSDTSDLVIQFCLEKKIYDIDLVNQALDHFSLKPLIR